MSYCGDPGQDMLRFAGANHPIPFWSNHIPGSQWWDFTNGRWITNQPLAVPTPAVIPLIWNYDQSCRLLPTPEQKPVTRLRDRCGLRLKTSRSMRRSKDRKPVFALPPELADKPDPMGAFGVAAAFKFADDSRRDADRE